MASKAKVICLLFVFATEFFAIGSATHCTYDSDCDTWESCCSDSVCRKTCYYCFYNYQCGTGETCCDGGDCLSVCTTKMPTTIPYYTGYTTVWTGGVIAASIISTIVFFAIVISIVACCCCACCPCYHHRSPGPGTVFVSQPANQAYVTTTQTSATIQQVQQYPPRGNYNQPQPGYGQPLPPYLGYPQQPAQYPPPQAQGQSPMLPSVSVDEPVKYKNGP